MDNDNDPLDTGINLDPLDGCGGIVVVTLIGAVVVAAGLILSALTGLGFDIP
jgi:hypothetical protein